MGIKQQQFQKMQTECDDMDKLKQWSLRRREEIRDKVVGAMPNMEPGHFVELEEEEDEFKDEQKDGFGLPNAVKEGVKRKKLYAKKEELRKKKEAMEKRRLAKHGPPVKSKAVFIKNKEAALRKELANAAKSGKHASLQLEHADLADEFRMSLQVSAMERWIKVRWIQCEMD
jgi:hypothetical protein